MKRIARGIQRFVLDNPTPFIVKCNHTSNRTKYDCFRGQPLEEPLKTITQTHGYAVVTPHLTKFRTGATGLELTEPAPTVTAGTSQRPGGNGHVLGIVEAQLTPFISRQFGSSFGHAVDEPAGTVTAGGGGKSALVSAFLAKHFGGNYTGPGAAMDAPAHTVTTTDHHGLVTANIMVNNTGQPAQPVGQFGRAANKLPAGRAKRVNPPLTATILKKSLNLRSDFFLPGPRQRHKKTRPEPGFVYCPDSQWLTVSMQRALAEC